MKLLDLISLEELQRIQDAFAYACGVSSSISTPDGRRITTQSNMNEVCRLVRNTEEGRRRCTLSDRELGRLAAETMTPSVRPCLSSGFLEASAPIVVGGHHIANWQISHNASGVTEKKLLSYAREIGVEEDAMRNAFRKRPCMSPDKFREILDLLWTMANEISSRSYANLNLHRERDSLRDMASKLTLAEEHTKRKIALALHDSVGHELVALKRLLRSVRKERSSHDLDRGLELVESVIGTTRDLTFQLSSPILYDLGLSAALEALAEDILAPRGISFRMKDDAPEYDTPTAVRVQLYQMVRELFQNVVKHAEATEVDVTIDVSEGVFSVTMSDDGLGFGEDDANHGLGLFSIKERLRHYGGRLNISSRRNRGTDIELTLPVGPETAIGKETEP